MLNNKTRYGHISVFLHWFTLLALIAIYSSAELRFLPDSEEGTELMKAAHYSLGLLVFFMVMIRIAVKLTTPSPEIYPPLDPKAELMAKLGHWALYAFLVGMPLCGWFYLSSRGLPIHFFSLDIPALCEKHKDWIANIKYIHYYAGTIGYILIATHAGAALYHHYIRGDNTLLRMLPFKRALLNFDDKAQILPSTWHENLIRACRKAAGSASTGRRQRPR
jgi:cytochrome b561